jgi:uncharacterized membrane protein YtjA (UPF0391 family)
MKANMGTLDRVVRTVVALAIGALYFTGKISGTVAAVLGFFAVVFLVTSLVSRCPLYVPLGLNTRKEPGA